MVLNSDFVIKAALDKLDDPKQQQGKSSTKAQAVFPFVLKTLKEFCKQEQTFADAVVKQEKTVGMCCEEVCKNIGNHISDIDLYKKVVAFYFPKATIEFQMKVVTKSNDQQIEPERAAVVLNLFDMM